MPSINKGTTRAAAISPVLRLFFISAVHAFPQHFRTEYGLGTFLKGGKHAPPEADDVAESWFYLISAAVLVILGGAFAGLTIAYVIPNKREKTTASRSMD